MCIVILTLSIITLFDKGHEIKLILIILSIGIRFSRPRYITDRGTDATTTKVSKRKYLRINLDIAHCVILLSQWASRCYSFPGAFNQNIWVKYTEKETVKSFFFSKIDEQNILKYLTNNTYATHVNS